MNNWHSKETDQIIEELNSDMTGLTEEEAQSRLLKYGYNQLPEKKRVSAFVKFLQQFKNVLIYVLLGAAVVTAFLNHWIDTFVILAVVIINAFIGYVQEGKAEKALEGIKQMMSLKAMVLREGKRHETDSKNLVPGDIVLLKPGDKIPADLRIIEAHSLKADESPLTGESTAVTKKPSPVSEESLLGDRKSMAYSGTTVVLGTGMGIVVATGAQTELGKINTMISEADEFTTPLLKQINKFAFLLSLIILAASVLFFLFGYFVRGYALGELFLIIIGLAVAAIPEGLPAIITITLAIGVQRMAKRHAIIRKLPSVEVLGSVSVICSDKTGTLTKNEMTAKTAATLSTVYSVEGIGYAPEGGILKDGKPVNPEDEPELYNLLKCMRICNNAQIEKNKAGQWELKGAPTEGAILSLALKGGLKDLKTERISILPFSSEHKYMATLSKIDDEYYIHATGAPDVLLKMTVTGESELSHWDETMNSIASKGQRLIGCAYKRLDEFQKTLEMDDLKEGMVFLGVAGLIDPPRKEAIEAISECSRAGIKVKMITGDHAVTAMAIGKEMGIGNGINAVTGLELEKADDEQLKTMALENDIFARTSPEHKLRLVRALQSQNRICAMTGDGVNDAPALKQADVGIAMGIKGTEVTKDSSDMVLTDDNFASIINAVEEGRTVYDNIRKTLLFILPTNVAESLVLILGILLGMAIPITPVQILWVNMVTAVTLALAISFEPMEKRTMDRPPRDPSTPILGIYFIWRILFVSLLIGGLTFLIYTRLTNLGYDILKAQTVAVNTLVAGQIFYLFNCRKIYEPALSKGFLENKVAFIAVGILIPLQLIFTYVPFMNLLFGTSGISPVYWLYPVMAGMIVFTLVELEKMIYQRVSKR